MKPNASDQPHEPTLVERHAEALRRRGVELGLADADVALYAEGTLRLEGERPLAGSSLRTIALNASPSERAAVLDDDPNLRNTAARHLAYEVAHPASVEPAAIDRSMPHRADAAR